MSQLKAITDESFQKDVLEASQERPIVVDFWAAWCGPCRMLTPILEELSDEHPDTSFVGVDVDANPALSQAFQIRSIPTVVKIHHGKVVKAFSGALPKPAVEQALELE